MKTVIALSGFKGSGKDTFAEILQNNLKSKGVDSNLISFATPIKKTLEYFYGITCEDYDKKEEKAIKVPFQKEKISYRDLMIAYGEHLKKFDKRIFSNWVYNQVRNTKGLSIITDVRFNVELKTLKYLKKEGYRVYHYWIVRKEAVPEWLKIVGSSCISDLELQKIVKKDFEVSPSECEILFNNPKFSGFIKNDGTISDLETNYVNPLVEKLLKN